jgi:hypothetical protein
LFATFDVRFVQTHQLVLRLHRHDLVRFLFDDAVHHPAVVERENHHLEIFGNHRTRVQHLGQHVFRIDALRAGQVGADFAAVVEQRVTLGAGMGEEGAAVGTVGFLQSVRRSQRQVTRQQLRLVAGRRTDRPPYFCQLSGEVFVIKSQKLARREGRKVARRHFASTHRVEQRQGVSGAGRQRRHGVGFLGVGELVVMFEDEGRRIGVAERGQSAQGRCAHHAVGQQVAQQRRQTGRLRFHKRLQGSAASRFGRLRVGRRFSQGRGRVGVAEHDR